MVFVEIKDKVRLIHLIYTGLSEWSRGTDGGRTEDGGGGIAFPELRPASGWTQLTTKNEREITIDTNNWRLSSWKIILSEI